MAAALLLNPPALSPVHAPPASAGRADKAIRSYLRDRAFTLYCQGHRSPAIADHLGVSERTVRFWIAAARADIQAESPASRADLLADAVAGAREVLSAAWQAYERDTAVQADLLQGKVDYVTRRRIQRRVAANPYGSTAADYEDHVVDETYARPRIPCRAPAYLRLALDANRNIARLLGLYSRPAPDRAPAPTSASGSDLPSATQPHIPAKTATAATPVAPVAPPAGLPPSVAPTPHPRFPAIPARTATTATASLGSASVVSASGALPIAPAPAPATARHLHALPVVSMPPAAVHIPAKTATTATTATAALGSASVMPAAARRHVHAHIPARTATPTPAAAHSTTREHTATSLLGHDRDTTSSFHPSEPWTSV